MIEEAIRNAQEVSTKFAQDSASTLGKIKTASQGQFSIEDRDSNTPYIKKARECRRWILPVRLKPAYFISGGVQLLSSTGASGAPALVAETAASQAPLSANIGLVPTIWPLLALRLK